MNYETKSYRLNKKTINNLAKIKRNFKTYNLMFAKLVSMYSKLQNDKQNNEIKTYKLKVGDTCPYCGAGFIEKRDGKFGEFWACDNFPRCGFTQGIKKYK